MVDSVILNDLNDFFKITYNDKNKFHVIAALCRGKNILQITRNDQFNHAEDLLIRKFLNSKKSKTINLQTKKLNLVVVKFTRSGKIGSAIPCRECGKEINKHKFIRFIYYSNDCGEIVKEQAYCYCCDIISPGRLWLMSKCRKRVLNEMK